MKIVKGWIQNSKVAGVAFERHPVAMVTGKVKTGLPLNVKGVTLHNTGNAAPSADARAHARWLVSVEAQGSAYVGAHFFVDAARIVQVLPINEVAWHAGDGHGPGNRSTIAIEICETAPYAQSEANGVALAVALCRYFKVKPYIHQDWSGKYCPRKILARGAWPALRQKIITQSQKPTKEKVPAPKAEYAPWAKKAVAFVQEKGYMTSDQRGFRGYDHVTRQEMAALVYKILRDHHV